MTDEDEDELTIKPNPASPERIPSSTSVIRNTQGLAFPTDPISTLLLLPLLPLIALMNLQTQMINQLNQQTTSIGQSQGRTKVTSITRNGNTLDIIEKWI